MVGDPYFFRDISILKMQLFMTRFNLSHFKSEIYLFNSPTQITERNKVGLHHFIKIILSPEAAEVISS